MQLCLATLRLSVNESFDVQMEWPDLRVANFSPQGGLFTFQALAKTTLSLLFVAHKEIEPYKINLTRE